jgi:predicted dehydrogenase
MEAPLRIGIAGLGYIGSLHARIFEASARANVCAVADTNMEIARAFAQPRSIAAYASVEVMLQAAKLDAVSICLPDREHVAAAIAAARTGVAILLEKPMAHDLTAVREIAAAVRESGAKLMVGHVLRFDPRYCALFERATPEFLGTPIHLRAARNAVRSLAARLGTRSSILFYLGVHDVDALQWISRSRIRRVYARSVNALHVSSEDAIQVLCEFANGAIGTLEYSWAWPDGLPSGFNQQLEIVGTKSALVLDTSRDGFAFIDSVGLASDDHYLWPQVRGDVHGCLRAELEHFCTAVQTMQPFAQPWEDAAAAVAVLDAIRESIHSGSPCDVRNAL